MQGFLLLQWHGSTMPCKDAATDRYRLNSPPPWEAKQGNWGTWGLGACKWGRRAKESSNGACMGMERRIHQV